MKKILPLIAIFFFYSCEGKNPLEKTYIPNSMDSFVLWYADMEEGNLYDWTYGDNGNEGGGIFITSYADTEAEASKDFARTGSYSAKAYIEDAYRAENGNKAVRFMRWTDKMWSEGGEYFPSNAYYGTWMYFPHTYNPNKYEPWDPGDGGWWNVFQFKSDDAEGESQPVWVLNVGYDESEKKMYFYLYSKYNPPNSYTQSKPLYFSDNEWIHVEAYYTQTANDSGKIKIWQNGVLIFNIENVKTILAANSTFGIGNYTDHIMGGAEDGSASIYFDDAHVATKRVYPYFLP